MLENMTTGEKVIAGATAVGIAALIFHKPTRNAVGLSDRVKSKYGEYSIINDINQSYKVSAKNEKEAKKLAKELAIYDIRTEKNISKKEAESLFKTFKVKFDVKKIGKKIGRNARFNTYMAKSNVMNHIY